MYLKIIKESEKRGIEKMLIDGKDVFLKTEKIVSNDKFVVSIRYDLMEKPFEFYLDVDKENIIDELLEMIKKDEKIILKVKDNGLPPLGYHRGLKIVQNDFMELVKAD